MAGVARLGLDRAGEFLEIAALLVRIKAQMLMPRRSGEGDELEDPRAELVRRLLEYEHYREAALRMEDAQQARARQFRRGYFPPRQTPEKVVVETPLEVTWEEVWLAVLRLNEIPPGPDDHIVAQRAVPVDEKIGLILHTLARLARIDFRHLVEPYHDRMHSAVTFVAGLELAKRRRLALRQSEPFATLWLYRRPPEDALEEELPTAEAAEPSPAGPGDAPQRDEEEHATHADH
jgi:segregation and condensation protein A